MVWNTPVAGVAGQVITAAWSTSNVVEPLLHLRLMTGNADPPGSDYVVRSGSTTTTSWSKVLTDMIQDAQVTDVKLADAKVSKTAANYANMALAAAGGSGFATSFQSGGNVDGPSASDWFVTTINSSPRTVQIITSIYDENLTYIRLIVSGTPTSWKQMWHSGNDGSGSGLDADTVRGLAGVPAGLIAAFRTAAAIPAGWARCDGAAGRPNMDGRTVIGAGTTFSVTFTENTTTGAAWSHTHAAGTYSVSGATAAPANPSQTNTVANIATTGAASATGLSHFHSFGPNGLAGDSASTDHTPPAFVVVWAIKS